MGTCILNRDRNLVSQRIEDLCIFRQKCIHVRALHIQNTDDMLASLEWKSQLRLRIREVRVFLEGGIQLNVQSDAGASRRSNVAHDPCLADLQSVFASKHLS